MPEADLELLSRLDSLARRALALEVQVNSNKQILINLAEALAKKETPPPPKLETLSDLGTLLRDLAGYGTSAGDLGKVAEVLAPLVAVPPLLSEGVVDA